MSNRQKLLAKKEIHAQLNMEQRFVVATGTLFGVFFVL